MTYETSGMSNPRAATSVAIITEIRLSRNDFNAFSRARWDLSP